MKIKKKKKAKDVVEVASVSDGMRSFENLGGPHFEPGEKVGYEKGSIVNTDRDLVRAYPGKFQEVFHGSKHPGIEAAKARKKTSTGKAKDGDPKSKASRSAKTPAGKDVTEDFTDVGKKYRVYLDGEYFALTNVKSGKVLVSHKDKLKIQDAINERNAPKDEVTDETA